MSDMEAFVSEKFVPLQTRILDVRDPQHHKQFPLLSLIRESIIHTFDTFYENDLCLDEVALGWDHDVRMAIAQAWFYSQTLEDVAQMYGLDLDSPDDCYCLYNIAVFNNYTRKRCPSTAKEALKFLGEKVAVDVKLYEMRIDNGLKFFAYHHLVIVEDASEGFFYAFTCSNAFNYDLTLPFIEVDGGKQPYNRLTGVFVAPTFEGLLEIIEEVEGCGDYTLTEYNR